MCDLIDRWSLNDMHVAAYYALDSTNALRLAGTAPPPKKCPNFREDKKRISGPRCRSRCDLVGSKEQCIRWGTASPRKWAICVWGEWRPSVSQRCNEFLSLFMSIEWSNVIQNLTKSTTLLGCSVAEWLACWTQAQKGPGSNRSRDADG